MASLTYEGISDALKKLHYSEGRAAAMLGVDRGICPHHFSPDKDNWLDGYDSVANETKDFYAADYGYFD